MLKAHARIITNDENPSLYQMRYSARPSIFVKFPSSPTFAIRKTIAAKHLLPTVKFLPLILVTFGVFYIIVYLAIVCVIIFTPGTGILIRAILIILSVGLELLAIIIPFFGLFIAVKDPNSGKTFWNKIRSAVNQNIARTGSAAES